MEDRGTYTFGDYRLDAAQQVLLRSGQPVRLTPKAMGMLLALVERHGELVEKQQLFARVWPGVVVEDCNLAQHVASLRRMLGDLSETPRFIETVPRRGYRFIAPVAVEWARPPAPRAEVEPGPVPPGAAGEMRGGRPRTRLLGLGSVVAAAFLLSSSAGSTAPGPATSMRSLALLPFVNLTGDARQDQVAEAMTRALQRRLGRVHALRVPARTSAQAYREAQRPVRALADELAVEGLVEGAILRAGDRIQVAVQIVDARLDAHLWSETFEEDAIAMPALEAAIARGILDQLQVELRPEDKLRLARARPARPDAYRAYTLGRVFSSRRTVEGVLRGVDQFEQSIARDPGYALAHAGLADAYALAAEIQVLPLASSLRLARTAAQTALRLDPDLAEAHQSLAAILEAEWDWEGALRHLERAVELAPGSEVAHRRLGEFLTRRGRHAEALAHVQRARELEPASPAANAAVGAAYHYAGRQGEAIHHLRETVQLDPHCATAHALLGSAYDAAGRHAEAVGALRTAVELSGRVPGYLAALARAQALAGAGREARALLGELEASARGGLASSFHLARVLSALGERDRALRMLEAAFEERFPALPYLGAEPVLPELREHPRVAALLGRMGLLAGPGGQAAACPAGAACPAAAGCAAEPGERVNVGPGGAGQALPDAPSMSRDGRFVAFASEAPDLVAGDTNQVADVFVRDTCRTVAGPVADCRPSIRRVSTTAAGAQGDQPSRHPFISGDGNYVVFATRANLDPRRDANDVTRRWDLYRADRRTGQVRLVNAAGRLSHGLYVSPPSPVASHDGRFVAWTVPSDPRELLLRDMELDSLEVVAHGAVGRPAVSDDGRFLAFATVQAYDGADANGAADVYLLDRGTSSFTRITDAAGAGSVRGDLGIGMSGDGKVIAYVTRDGMVDSSGIADTNGALDVYVHDRRAARHRVHLVSASFARTASRSPAAGAARPVVSADGRAVAFESTAGDLVSPAAGAAGHPADGASAGVFVRDLDAGRTRRVSAGACREAGGQAAPAGLALSGDGALVAFLSPAQEHGGDGGSGFDVFATR